MMLTLYPNVPIEETLIYVTNWLENCVEDVEKREILSEVTEMCMNKNQFVYDVRFFQIVKRNKHGKSVVMF